MRPERARIDERDEREPEAKRAAALELARACELVLGCEADEEEEERGREEEGKRVQLVEEGFELSVKVSGLCARFGFDRE